VSVRDFVKGESPEIQPRRDEAVYDGMRVPYR